MQSGASTKILDSVRGFGAVNPPISPDGSYLYYEAQDGDVTVLMRMNVASGAKQEVLRPPSGFLRIYSLSPDGTQIVCNWRKEPKLLHEVPKDEWARAWGGLAWAADGLSVLYHREEDPNGSDELIRIPLSGGAPEGLFTTGIIRRIAVHRDGRHITFEARSGNTEVCVMENLFPR